MTIDGDIDESFPQINTMFGSKKYREKKIVKKSDFFILRFIMKNIKKIKYN